jgi:excisionase family DNA binding protein
MPLLNVDQAAERLGTSPRFIRRLIAERRIAFTKLGKHVRIDSADLDAFVAAGRVEPGVDATSQHAGRPDASSSA